LLTVSEFFEVYEWVLNPDGNEETTNDVPRVINNSWGYDYEIAAEFNACSLPESSIVETLEVAGICSPFSAGNEGPGVSTVGYPAMLAYNVVNPMSVAAITATNAIANFSSRGPSTCVDEESALKIKPEVAAPGVNVRSCVGANSYNNLQGTSMACPHVSGALLLLAEAFPMASARELKESLYYTAIDLGDEGEDNTFGRGLIDCLAAFNYLAQTYQPVPPVSNFDISVSMTSTYDDESLNDAFATCVDENPSITITINTLGEIDANEIFLEVKNGETILIDTIFLNVTARNTLTYTLNNVQLNPGYNEVIASASTSANALETDIYNNDCIERFIKYTVSDFPRSINFEEVSKLLDEGMHL
ncbi:MAG: S8 family serine peptidase, partial [Bacteroidales bacterium]|nr:S8 family serine peptidase [Bacteroidales bacterium]